MSKMNTCNCIINKTRNNTGVIGDSLTDITNYLLILLYNLKTL